VAIRPIRGNPRPIFSRLGSSLSNYESRLLSSHSLARSSFSILSLLGAECLYASKRVLLWIIPERCQRRNKERSALHPGHDHEEPRDAGFV